MPQPKALPGLLLVLVAHAAGAPQDDPLNAWRANAALATPDWLSVTGSFTTRYESLSNRLRRPERGSNRGLFNRALVAISLRDRFTEATVEAMDARVLGEPGDARTTTGQVNAAEFVQAYVAARFEGALEPGDELRVLLGRHTMDIGSRRLVARPIYRNTLNSFTGLNATWRGGNAFARAFYTLPVQRLPGDDDVDALRDGEVEADEERGAARFFGLHGGVEGLPLDTTLTGFVYGLREEDARDLATRDRRLTTVGVRLWRAPARGAVHWELESALQFGTSRASASSTEDLDHGAYLHHVTLGYTLDGDHATRIEALFDIASGDRSPDDGENNRFDSLFGIPRQEFGPTGIFRALGRSNLVSPGVRLFTTPAPGTRVMLMHRLAYLASDRDAWTNGYVDPTGRSGSHIGDLTELMVQRTLVPDSLDLEVGAAYWAAGTFAESAPGARSPNDALFGYVQLRWFF